MDPIPSESRSTLGASMEQPTLTATKVFVRDLQDGQDVDSVFLVRDRKLAETRNGDAFLRLELGDVTGSLQAVAWDGATEAAAACEPGAVVHASGRFSIHERYGRQLKLRGVRTAAHGEYELADLLEGPPVTYDKMSADLDELIGTVQHPHLRELLARLLSRDSEVGHRWHQAPAAKYYHQAYRHGLLEHCLS